MVVVAVMVMLVLVLLVFRLGGLGGGVWLLLISVTSGFKPNLSPQLLTYSQIAEPNSNPQTVRLSWGYILG